MRFFFQRFQRHHPAREGERLLKISPLLLDRDQLPQRCDQVQP
jgi:hypothetical protein